MRKATRRFYAGLSWTLVTGGAVINTLEPEMERMKQLAIENAPRWVAQEMKLIEPDPEEIVIEEEREEWEF